MKINKKVILKTAALFLAFAGILLLYQVVAPLISYQITAQTKFPTLISPLSGGEIKGSEVNDQVLDYTKASNWFAGVDKSKFSESQVSYYTIAIPKLRIENATVAIGGEDLTKHLIQYPGTALPGKRGNAVIFGHSTLPSLYDPKDYVSIFSTLPTLDLGDEIKVYYDGIEYLYQIESMFEVGPTDIQVLEQNLSDAFVTLVTCTPPGDPRKPKRLIVRARIMPVDVGYANTGN